MTEQHFDSKREAVFDAIAHGEEYLAAEGFDNPGVYDIVVHEGGCRLDEVDLCTCEPQILHHGHEAADCDEHPPFVAFPDGQ